MNAADVLAAVTGSGERKAAALLVYGEQGVAILPDGTLWALSEMAPAGWWDMIKGQPHLDLPALYRLLPLSAEAGDTDA